MKQIFIKKVGMTFLLATSLFALAACNDTTTVEIIDDKIPVEVYNNHEQGISVQAENKTTENKASDNTNTTESVKKNETVTTSETPKFGNSKDISYEVGFEDAVVTKVTDGDTVKVKTKNGEELSLRLLLIDTPETKHPSKPVEPFGPEASAFAKEFLAVGLTVQLEYDVSGKSLDKYGRTLAYIWKDGVMYNEEVIRKGLARVAYIYAPNTRHVDLFYAAQKEAQNKGIGIWSIENYATDKGFNSDITTDSSKSSSTSNASTSSNNTNTNVNANVNANTSDNSSCNIKGNISSSGEKIYHSPGQSYYDKTQEEEMFCSVQEAELAGYRASKR